MGAAEIRRTVRGVGNAAARQIKRLAFQIHTNVIRATPIDTGWARANWVISIGRPAENTVGSPDAVSRGEQQIGLARLLAYRVEFGSVWISNNVPYIQALNAGHSKQAPAGFVEAAVDQAVRTIIR